MAPASLLDHAVSDSVSVAVTKNLDGTRKTTQQTDSISPDVISFIRKNSPFYAQSLAHLPQNVSLSDLPLTDVRSYWASPKETLTTPFVDGTVMRSGATTGKPKFVHYSREELNRICTIKAVGVVQSAGLVSGDRIANLCPMGGLYGSFLFNNTAIMNLPIDTVQLPMGMKQSIEETVSQLPHTQIPRLTFARLM